MRLKQKCEEAKERVLKTQRARENAVTPPRRPERVDDVTNFDVSKNVIGAVG